jgi:prepilin-type processing-associated H-X9-DG protein
MKRRTVGMADGHVAPPSSESTPGRRNLSDRVAARIFLSISIGGMSLGRQL